MVQPGLSSSTEVPATVQRRNNEPMTGIEPAYRPWQGRVLPLNYIDITAHRAVRSYVSSADEDAGIVPHENVPHSSQTFRCLVNSTAVHDDFLARSGGHLNT